ncbi:hypothetical protein [Brevibacterium album]|uniref:hypothetical protein n=1 Tax=Brevibacterium album TaxID=417948 RepID=UPI0003F83EC3|nr:hypothetical protein [Brevibacterium album]
MRTYAFEPTEIESACGVTAEAVAEQLPKVYAPAAEDFVAVPGDLSPALAGAVARTALAGPVEFQKIDAGMGLLIYRPAEEA